MYNEVKRSKGGDQILQQFDLNVGIHKGSVLNPLAVTVQWDEITKEDG